MYLYKKSKYLRDFVTIYWSTIVKYVKFVKHKNS